MLGIWMVLNKGATALSRFTSSHRALASWVSTNSSPAPGVVESIAALKLVCHSSSIRGFNPEGSLIWAVSRLRMQAMSKRSRPVYLP